MGRSSKSWQHATKSSSARGYGAAWQRLRKVVLERDAGLCRMCIGRGVVTLATQVDHIKPKARGGEDTEANCQAICTACHDAKTLADSGKKRRPQIGVDGWPVDQG